jgi:DNA-binding GntR family transcriptional regulator
VQPYQRIAADLRADIEAGRLAVGAKVPTTRALIDKYGVSAPTAHHAISLLRSEGLVETRSRLGSYVRDPAEIEREKSLREELDEVKERLAALEAVVATLQDGGSGAGATGAAR